MRAVLAWFRADGRVLRVLLTVVLTIVLSVAVDAVGTLAGRWLRPSPLRAYANVSVEQGLEVARLYSREGPPTSAEARAALDGLGVSERISRLQRQPDGSVSGVVTEPERAFDAIAAWGKAVETADRRGEWLVLIVAGLSLVVAAIRTGYPAFLVVLLVFPGAATVVLLTIVWHLLTVRHRRARRSEPVPA